LAKRSKGTDCLEKKMEKEALKAKSSKEKTKKGEEKAASKAPEKLVEESPSLPVMDL
jgi:hypothetical protein